MFVHESHYGPSTFIPFWLITRITHFPKPATLKLLGSFTFVFWTVFFRGPSTFTSPRIPYSNFFNAKSFFQGVSLAESEEYSRYATNYSSKISNPFVPRDSRIAIQWFRLENIIYFKIYVPFCDSYYCNLRIKSSSPGHWRLSASNYIYYIGPLTWGRENDCLPVL